MVSQYQWIVVALLAAILACRDGAVLASLRQGWVWFASGVLLASAGLGILSDSVTRAEFWAAVRQPAVYLPSLALHAAVFVLLVRGRRRWPLFLVWATPASLVTAGVACWFTLQSFSLPGGLWAGIGVGSAWTALALAASRLRWSTERARSFAALTQFLGLAFFPITVTDVSMNSIHDLLYVLSNAFLLPTLLGTLAAFAYGVWVLARFAAEWRDRRANVRLLDEAGASPSLAEFCVLPLRHEWREFQEALAGNVEALREKAVTDLEHRMITRVERLGIMAKVGPMLGLIGTLIPLQPALAGLAKGDMQAMGANLQIGFTTTVLGLLVGGTCYAVGTVLRGWYQQDVTDMYFLLSLWSPERGREIEPVEFETANHLSRFESR